MEKKDYMEVLLKFLKEKGEISELEEDILTTILTYKKESFDRTECERKIAENNLKYLSLSATITSLLGSYSKPFVRLSDDDIKHSMFFRFLCRGICQKEQIQISVGIKCISMRKMVIKQRVIKWTEKSLNLFLQSEKP